MKKSVLITGSSRGLGNGLTAGYLKRGFRVFACARSKNSPGFIDLRKEFGDLLQVFEMDISDTSSIIHTAAEIKSMTDCLDILINNAGIHEGCAQYAERDSAKLSEGQKYEGACHTSRLVQK